MAEILITISDQDEVNVLTDLAAREEVSTIEYATNIIRSFIQRQIRGSYSNFANQARLTTLKDKLGDSRQIPASIKEDLKKGAE